MNVFQPNCTVLWRRVSAVLLNAVTVAALHTVNATPVAAAQVEVALGGTPTGTVTITGTQGGSTVTETLIWTGVASPPVLCTYRAMDVVTSIATSLTGATTITARLVAPDGTPHGVLTTIRGPAWPAFMDESTDPRTDQASPGKGTVRLMYCHLPFEYGILPMVADQITNEQTGEVYRVEGYQPLPSGMQPSQWQCRLRPMEP